MSIVGTKSWVLLLPLCLTGCTYHDTYEVRAASVADPTVDRGQYLTDQALSARVAAVLLHDPHFRNADIHVAAVDNVVTLSGTVPDGRDIRRAQDIAAGVPGVRGVENALTPRG